MTTATEYTGRLAQAIARGQASRSPLDQDLSRWPADVVDVVQLVCKLWHLRAPATKTSKALWIRDARELLDAAGEYELDALREYRRDFEEHMRAHSGVAQHTVSGPGSLVKMVRAKAAMMRDVPQERGYLDGEFASFIER